MHMNMNDQHITESNSCVYTAPDDCETLHWRDQTLSLNELAAISTEQNKISTEQNNVISDKTLRVLGVIANRIEDGTLFQSGLMTQRELADEIRTVLKAVGSQHLVPTYCEFPKCNSTAGCDGPCSK